MTAGCAWVLDASALLALLFNEPGGEMVERGLDSSAISAVSLSEVMQKSIARGVDVGTLRDDLAAVGVRTIDFDGDTAEEAANLWAETKRAGLSLGDRACLALARQLRLPAVTADQAWQGFDLMPAGVVVIR